MTGEYLKDMRLDGWPIRVANIVKKNGANTPVFGYGYEPDFGPTKNMKSRKMESSMIGHKRFKTGEWDKSLFDMQLYRPKANEFDGWLHDARREGRLAA